MTNDQREIRRKLRIREKCDVPLGCVVTVATFDKNLQVAEVAHRIDLDVEEELRLEVGQADRRGQIGIGTFCCVECP